MTEKRKRYEDSYNPVFDYSAQDADSDILQPPLGSGLFFLQIKFQGVQFFLVKGQGDVCFFHFVPHMM